MRAFIILRFRFAQAANYKIPWEKFFQNFSLKYSKSRKKVKTIDTITDLPNEEWKEIKDYNGYLVSNKARIKSLKHKQERLLTAFPNNKGYLRVCLCKNGKGRHFLLSRLVAEAFCENPRPEVAIVVDHIDGDILNNNADNLQWLTLSENAKKEWRKFYDIRQNNA